MLPSSAPQYVVDASVATKWHLRDEPDLAPADALLAAFREGRIELLAPDHIRYEVPNAIRNALRTRRLTNDQARTAIADFLAWDLLTVSDSALILTAYEQAIQIGCSLYDGVYLALAEAAGCPFVYADRRLHNGLAGRYSWAVWIADFILPI